ncbi:11915_t:CDS:1, partial [Acaulospora morrowiae]
MSSATSSTSLSSIHPQTTIENESHLGCEKSGGFFDSTLKMTGYRKRRLSKIPAPVIIPPPSPIVTAPSPVSPAISDSFLELPSPKTPQSPTKRFVLKPITALTAAFQRTSITGRNRSTSLLRLTKSSNNSPKSPKFGSPKASPQSPKPPKSPKLVHRKGSNGSIRKRSESPTSSAVNIANAVSLLSVTNTQLPTNNSKSSFFGKPSFSLSINTSSQTTTTKSASKLVKLRPPKSPSSCRKALPITPAELAEKLREVPSNNSKVDDEHPLHLDENSNYMFKPLHSNKVPKPVLIDVRNLALYQDEHI